MFFIMGISDGRKDLDFSQMVTCQACGRYGRYMVYMTYTFLSLFFIPTFRWNRQYYVQMSCCGRTYLLDPEVGKRIARGEQVEIQPQDLTPVGYSQGDWNQANWIAGGAETKRCSNCGYTTDEDFEYCPKCGRRL